MHSLGAFFMDEGVPQTLNPHLQRVLKSYQTAAIRSLSGPSGYPIISDLSKMSAGDLEEYRKAMVSVKKIPTDKGMDYDPFLAPPPFPIQQMPVFTPVDTSRSDKSETILEGETIACFMVGGEKRLCLPQILNTVLRDFTLQQINTVCDELHIFCSRCNHEQLETLKLTAILPFTAPSCGLITKTDAERLTNALLHGNPEKYSDPPSLNSFKVYHECFGKCKGIFHPELYIEPDAKCIQCVDCNGLFNPPKFVCHSHKALENRTCHWGFDSANWRAYLLLAKHQEGREKLLDAIEHMKARFDPTNKFKRKQSVETDSVLQKRLKGEVCLSPGEVSAWQDAGMRTVSAFQPWAPNVISAIKEGKLLPAPAIMREGLTGILPPYLHTGPPVLLHPERVIPYSESERYERHFTPNVSLAPPVSKPDKSEEDGTEECSKNSPSTKSVESSSRASTSGTTNNKDYREYDLPTDTDDSSLEQSSPSDAGDEVTFPDIPEVDSTLEAEIEMIRRVLDGKIPNTKEAKDNFLHEYSKLRVPHEEILNTVNQAKKSLTRELNAQKNRFKEELEKKKFLQKENNRIRIESECRLQEAAEDKEKLVAEVRRLKEREESGMNEKYLQMNMELEGRMQHFKSLYNDLQDENRILREELKRLGVDIVELLQRDKAIMNGKMKHTADIKSDMSSKLLQEALMKGELFYRRNNVLKRERIHLVD